MPDATASILRTGASLSFTYVNAGLEPEYNPLRKSTDRNRVCFQGSSRFEYCSQILRICGKTSLNSETR